MNKLKNMTREELINELESKGICVVLEIISSNRDELDFFITYDMAKTLSKVKADSVKICVEENDSNWYIRFILDGRYLLESTVKKVKRTEE